ncbi:MAG: hypothetical protein CME06_11835 [Gemmatimonadetes bacterium]|nr:hypothetical protein [Gemmatimonadota bacterium]
MSRCYREARIGRGRHGGGAEAAARRHRLDLAAGGREEMLHAASGITGMRSWGPEMGEGSTAREPLSLG